MPGPVPPQAERGADALSRPGAERVADPHEEALAMPEGRKVPELVDADGGADKMADFVTEVNDTESECRMPGPVLRERQMSCRAQGRRVSETSMKKH